MTTAVEANQIFIDAVKLADDMNPLFDGKDSRVVLGAISFHLANWSKAAGWPHARLLKGLGLLMDSAEFARPAKAAGVREGE